MSKEGGVGRGGGKKKSSIYWTRLILQVNKYNAADLPSAATRGPSSESLYLLWLLSTRLLYNYIIAFVTLRRPLRGEEQIKAQTMLAL